MAKKKKKIFTVSELVGDTSGYSDKENKLTGKRKLVAYIGLAGIIILIFAVIFFFVSPTKITFNYMNNRELTNISYEVDKKTGLLKEYPSDDIAENCKYATYYTFEGWCGNSNCTGVALKANSSKADISLYKHKFSKFKSTTLYAKWVAKPFNVTYDPVGNLQNFSLTEELNKLVKEINPTSYYIKHDVNTTEIENHQQYLISNKLVTDINTPSGLNKLNSLIEEYKTRELRENINLVDLTVDVLSKAQIKNLGWTFVGWYDEEGEKISSLDKTNPKNIKLTARWTKDN